MARPSPQTTSRRRAGGRDCRQRAGTPLGGGGGMLYALPSPALARRDCHGHCHVKSQLIGGEGLWGYSGRGGGLGHQALLSNLAPRWGSGRCCQHTPSCWGVGGRALFSPRGQKARAEPPGELDRAWQTPSYPQFNTLPTSSSPVPTQMQRMEGNPKPASGHVEALRVCIADRNHYCKQISPPPPRK